jgi:hypothetical protein
VFTESRSVTSTNHLPPGTETLVNPARRIGMVLGRAQRAEFGAGWKADPLRSPLEH